MEFLNPGLLWGALAISLPVILHFWHQKRGKELAWAANRWLSGLVLQKSRGMRLENILLLILRCLLLILLVLYLSEPLFRRFSGKQEKIHWVQAKKEVVENFRFELEEAGKKGEKRFWFNGEPVTELTVLPEDNHTDLQMGINKVKTEGSAEIYLSDTGDFTRFTKVYLPAPYTLHTLKSHSMEAGGAEEFSGNRLSGKEKGEALSVLLESGKVLAEEDNILPESEKSFSENEKVLTEGDKVLSTSRKVLPENRIGLMEAEKKSISAALKAITEVYGLHFEIDEQRRPGQLYDLVFSHQPDSSAGLSVVSGAASLTADRMTGHDRVIWFNELLKPETSDAVFNGELPEILLEAWLAGKETAVKVLSDLQLRDKFATRQAGRAESSFHSVILVLFILALGAERWLAIHKNS